jgi:hypothetical protein
MEIVDARKAAPDFVPVCPHCEHELKQVYRLHDTSRGMKLETSRGYGYACPPLLQTARSRGLVTSRGGAVGLPPTAPGLAQFVRSASRSPEDPSASTRRYSGAMHRPAHRRTRSPAP